MILINVQDVMATAIRACMNKIYSYRVLYAVTISLYDAQWTVQLSHTAEMFMDINN